MLLTHANMILLLSLLNNTTKALNLQLFRTLYTNNLQLVQLQRLHVEEAKFLSRHIHSHMKEQGGKLWQGEARIFTREKMDAGKLGIQKAIWTDT